MRERERERERERDFGLRCFCSLPIIIVLQVFWDCCSTRVFVCESVVLRPAAGPIVSRERMYTYGAADRSWGTRQTDRQDQRSSTVTAKTRESEKRLGLSRKSRVVAKESLFAVKFCIKQASPSPLVGEWMDPIVSGQKGE